MFFAVLDQDARVAVEVGAGVVAVKRQAVIAEVIPMAAVGVVADKAALEINNLERGADSL